MREILGKRRRLLSRRDNRRSEMLSAALTFATEWQWPVLPGVAPDPQGRALCGCPDPECTVPAHTPSTPASSRPPPTPAWCAGGGATDPPPRSSSPPATRLPARSACPHPRPPGPSPRSTARACASARSSPRRPAGRCSSSRTPWSSWASCSTPRTTSPARSASTARAAISPCPLRDRPGPDPLGARTTARLVLALGARRRAVVDAVVEALTRTGVSAPEL